MNNEYKLDPFTHLMFNSALILRTKFSTPTMLDGKNPYLFKQNEDKNIAKDSKIVISVADTIELGPKESRPIILVDMPNSISKEKRILSDSKTALNFSTGDSQHETFFSSYLQLIIRVRNKFECSRVAWLAWAVFFMNHNHICKALNIHEIGQRTASLVTPRKVENSASESLWESQVNMSVSLPTHWERTEMDQVTKIYNIDLITDLLTHIRSNE